MKTIGIIAEYNPFHNGHIYHLKCIKDLYPDSTIILVMSGSFTERGELSVLTKWEKTEIALNNGIDLVIELPFVFATQSADKFAKASVEILNHLNVDYLIFGSECNDINKLTNLAKTQIDNDKYNELIKEYLAKGVNYPTALSNSLNDLMGYSIKGSNDLLGISYIRSILELNSNIIPLTIKRSNDYFESATKIREALLNKKDILEHVPVETYNYLKDKDLKLYNDNIFKLLRYKINSETKIDIYNTVDEGIDNRIIKYINEVDSIDELIEKVKTKRYTYNKITRMLTHILCNFTKEDNLKFNNVEYIRILGFSDEGQQYLNRVKKTIKIPLLNKYSKFNCEMLEYEFRVTKIYAIITNNNSLIKEEYSNKPKKRLK